MSTISKVSFGQSSFNNQSLSERHRKRPILSSISQMSDEEIIRASIKNANKQAENTNAARALKNGPLMFIAATTIAAGALTKGKLSDKAVSAAKALGTMAVAGAVMKPVYNTVDKVLTRKDENGEIKKPHPAVDLAVNVAALTGATALIIAGAKKGQDKLSKVFAPAAETLKETFKKHADKLNGSSLGKLSDKISNKTAEFTTKHPKLANFGKTLGALSAASFATGGSLILANKVADEREKIACSNINKLTTMREFANELLTLPQNGEETPETSEIKQEAESEE